ncbi:hypothetical protein ACVWXO_002289 [Bradyrhizobium sp. LM2.7]
MSSRETLASLKLRRLFRSPSDGKTSSTIAAKIAVHFPASPESNPNFSRFAQIAVAFWADSNCDLPTPVCGELLDNNKKTEAECPCVA